MCCHADFGVHLVGTCFRLLPLLLPSLCGCTYVRVGGNEDHGPSCPVLCCAAHLGLSQSLRKQPWRPRGGLLPINAVYLSLGVLLDVQKYFHISDSHAGLLQTGKEPVLDPGTRALCYSVVVSIAGSRPLVFCRRELGLD